MGTWWRRHHPRDNGGDVLHTCDAYGGRFFASDILVEYYLLFLWKRFRNYTIKYYPCQFQSLPLDGFMDISKNVTAWMHRQRNGAFSVRIDDILRA